MHFKLLRGGVHLSARAHMARAHMARADVPPFRISETHGRIALKFGKWLRHPLARLLQKLMAEHSVRARVRTRVTFFPTFDRMHGVWGSFDASSRAIDGLDIHF